MATSRKLRAFRDPWWRIVVAAITAAIVVVLAVLSTAMFLVPRFTGGDSLTVLTGSMEPTFMPGDIMVVRGVETDDVCTQFSIGDIVTYFPEANDPALISHRVVGMAIGEYDDGTDCRLITQGDNNSAADEPVSPAQVRGQFMYGIPKLGWMRQWVQHNPMLAWGVIGAVCLAVYFLPGRRSTRVLTLPSGVAAVPSGAGPAGGDVVAAAHGAVRGAMTDVERDLWERELTLRERELALREAEFEAAHHTTTPTGATA